MNICKRCGKENQEHYKFCLGCGGELTSSAPATGGGAQKTVMSTALPANFGAPGGGGFNAPPSSLGVSPVAPPHGTSPTPPAGMAAVPAPQGYGNVAPPLGPPPLAQSSPPHGGGGATPFGGSSHGAPPSTYGAPPTSSPPFGGSQGSAGGPYGSPTSGPAPFSSGGLGPTGTAPQRPVSAGAPTGQQGNVPPPAGWGPGTPTPSAQYTSQPAPHSAPVFSPPAPSSPLYTPPGSQYGAPAPSAISAPSTGGTAGSQPVAPLGGPTRACPNCGTEVPASFVFCGACGNRLEPMTGHGRSGVTGELASARIAPVAEPKPRGRITLIRPDGSEGGTHDLEEGENQIGRSHGSLFENDGYLSPRHAEIVINAAGAVIRDLDSLNGVFVKMTGEEELASGDVFRIGQELLRFDAIAPPQPLEDGTEIMGSPNPGYWGRLSVIIGKEIDGSAYPLFGDSMTIGRERGDINFPDDGYVSGVHARITQRDGKCYIVDLNSSNGTFVRLRGERVVQDGAFVLFGQQLFRTNLNVG